MTTPHSAPPPDGRRPPVAVVGAIGLLAVSILWWLIELPRAIAGLLGPEGELGATAAVAAVLMAVPMLLELAAAVLVWLRRGWARFLLVPVAFIYVVGLATGGGPLIAIDLLLLGGATALLFAPTSRAWFAADERAAMTGIEQRSS